MVTTTSPDGWLRCYQSDSQARLRLFCFPYAGGGTSVFYSWPQYLLPEVEVCPVQLPGRELKLNEPPINRLSPLVETLAQVLLPYLNMPFAFFGHSMGGLISFELARQLRKERKPCPVHLFVSAYRAPQLPDPDPPIHQLPEDEFVAELRNIGGTPENILQDAELKNLFLPLLRADIAVCETYKYTDEAPLDCPISVFGGTQDGEVNQEELAAWSNQTCASFNLCMFPGDHFFLHSAHALVLQVLARASIKVLRQLDTSTKPVA